MKVNCLVLRSCSALLSLTLLFGLSSCGRNSTSTSSTSASEDAVVASSVAEPSLSVTHPFLYSDATWTSTPADVEALIEKAPDKASFIGERKKSYIFNDTEYNTLTGTCAFIFKDELLCKTNYVYDSSQPFDDISTDFIDGLKEVYGEPTSDKSETSDGNTNIWLEWSNDNSKISYFYSFNDNKYNLVLAYELPENNVPTIDTSDRNGDFRSGFWGDDIDTIYKYETAKFATVSDDNKTIMYSGTVAGHEAYILYDFDDEGKLYRGLYQFTDSYNEGSMYIAVFDSLKESLADKYGKPSVDKKKKLSSLADYTDDGTALQLGYTMYSAQWTTESTEITLGMISVNYEIGIMMEYKDSTHAPVKDSSGL